MLFAVTFLLVAVVLATYAVLFGGWALVAPLARDEFCLVGLAYAGLRVHVFGKRANGTYCGLRLLALFPFLVFTSQAAEKS